VGGGVALAVWRSTGGAAGNDFAAWGGIAQRR